MPHYGEPDTAKWKACAVIVGKELDLSALTQEILDTCSNATETLDVLFEDGVDETKLLQCIRRAKRKLPHVGITLQPALDSESFANLVDGIRTRMTRVEKWKTSLSQKKL